MPVRGEVGAAREKNVRTHHGNRAFLIDFVVEHCEFIGVYVSEELASDGILVASVTENAYLRAVCPRTHRLTTL